MQYLILTKSREYLIRENSRAVFREYLFSRFKKKTWTKAYLISRFFVAMDHMSGSKEILERYKGMAKSYKKESTNGKFDDCTKENWLIYRLKLTVN